jgi:hypothetical protein
MEMAEQREPYESRGSRTVLGEPGGETPPGDSTSQFARLRRIQNMSTAGNILMGDLARMAHEATPQLAVRVTHDQRIIDDHEFLQTHKMTRQQFAERQRLWDRTAFEERAIADLNGDPPSGVSTVGLSPARAQYVRFHGWLVAERDKLATLEAKRTELQGMVDGAVDTEGEIKKLIRRSADFLLGRSAEDSDASQRLALETKRAEQIHRSEVARVALPDLQRDIEIAEVRCKRLQERESEFLVPAIFEVVEKSSIVERWQKLRDEGDALEEQLRGLMHAFVPPHGFSYPWTPPREKPFKSLDARKAWAAMAEAMRSDPRAKVKVPA